MNKYPWKRVWYVVALLVLVFLGYDLGPLDLCSEIGLFLGTPVVAAGSLILGLFAASITRDRKVDPYLRDIGRFGLVLIPVFAFVLSAIAVHHSPSDCAL